MKKIAFFSFAFLFYLQLIASAAAQAQTNPPQSNTKPAAKTVQKQARSSHWTASYEILGAGVVGSLTGSYWLWNGLVLNLGAGYVVNDNTLASTTSAEMTPLAMFYPSFLVELAGSRHFFEILAGVDFAIGDVYVEHNDGPSTTFIEEPLRPIAGLGYRYWQPRGGFHYRFTGYYFISTGETRSAAWLGMSFGYAFRF